MTSSEALGDQLITELRAIGVSEADLEGLDAATLQRYLRARSGNVSKASSMLAATCTWRSSVGIDQLAISEFSAELGSGKMYVAGYDPAGRPVMVTRKRAEGLPPKDIVQYMKFLAFSLESGVKLMNGGEQWVTILDLDGYSRANSPPLSVSLATLRVLVDHYPERLHMCFIVDAPSIFSLLWSALWPFMDSVTRNKVSFINSKDYKPQIEEQRRLHTPAPRAELATSSTSTPAANAPSPAGNAAGDAPASAKTNAGTDTGHPPPSATTGAVAGDTLRTPPGQQCSGAGPTSVGPPRRQGTELRRFDRQQEEGEGAAVPGGSAPVAPEGASNPVQRSRTSTVTFLQVLEHYAAPYSESKFREMLGTVWAA
ncbi:MAG: hypothetical protein WDW36_008651 [Sanguina aurantia]